MVTKLNPGGAETAFWEPSAQKIDPVIIHTHFFTEHGGNGVYQGQDTIFL